MDAGESEDASADRPRTTWDVARKRKKRNRDSVTIALDPDVGKAWLEAQSDINRWELVLTQNGDDADALQSRDEAQQRLDGMRDLLEENSITFVFESLPRHEYEKLVQANPPKADQIKDARKTGALRKNQTLPFDIETFPPALIAASVVEPVDMTESAVQELWNGSDWGQSELNQIYECAMRANNSHPDVSTPFGSRGTRSFD
jgi:hypothetical protein